MIDYLIIGVLVVLLVDMPVLLAIGGIMGIRDRRRARRLRRAEVLDLSRWRRP